VLVFGRVGSVFVVKQTVKNLVYVYLYLHSVLVWAKVPHT